MPPNYVNRLQTNVAVALQGGMEPVLQPTQCTHLVNYMSQPDSFRCTTAAPTSLHCDVHEIPDASARIMKQADMRNELDTQHVHASPQL
jgi:hypothetical protein